MRYSKDLLDKAIVTINDGRIVGHVKDIYLTPDLSAMAGIHLGKEGLLRRKSLLIPLDSVVMFGIDVVLVKNGDVVTDDKAMPAAANWQRLDKLQGREVDTPGGTRVGNVGDVVLDEEGLIVGFALSRVLVEGPIAESRMIDRRAVIDSGAEDGVMTIDLARAENPDKPPVTAVPEPQPVIEQLAPPMPPAPPPLPMETDSPEADFTDAAPPAALPETDEEDAADTADATDAADTDADTTTGSSNADDEDFYRSY